MTNTYLCTNPNCSHKKSPLDIQWQQNKDSHFLQCPVCLQKSEIPRTIPLYDSSTFESIKCDRLGRTIT